MLYNSYPIARRYSLPSRTIFSGLASSRRSRRAQVGHFGLFRSDRFGTAHAQAVHFPHSDRAAGGPPNRWALLDPRPGDCI